MLGGRPRAELMRQFRAAHMNRWNRRFHLVGIPTPLASGALWVAAPVTPGLWVWPAIMMPLGFALQFIGHAIEGNRPEVFSDWRFLFVGVEWWTDLVRGRLEPPTR